MKLCVCLLHFRTWQCFVKFADIQNTGKRLAEANELLLTSHYRTLTIQQQQHFILHRTDYSFIKYR